MFKTRKPARKELKLSMSPEVQDEMEKLKLKTAVPTITDVIRHSLGTYSYIVDLQASGKTIIIRDADGKEELFPKVPQRS